MKCAFLVASNARKFRPYSAKSAQAGGCLIKINVNSYHTAHHNVTRIFRAPLCSLKLALL